MRIGILTDIHGDYDPMRRVLDRLEREGVDRLICLGDLVVHGNQPNQVVDFFREHPGIPVLKGNHDVGATCDEDELDGLYFFSASSRANTVAARSALTDENKEYLANLPLDLREGATVYTHAVPGNPFALLRRPELIAATFDAMGAEVMIAGHTHRTRVHHWPAGKQVWCSDHPAETRNWVLELVPGDRYIVNVGCTAQLKYDMFPPICAVYAPNEREIRFLELPDLR